jgi:CHAT domain-containing protein
MYRKLYPPERFPQGHPELATSLNNLGALLRDHGEYAQAELFYRQALAMRQKLHPAERFPQGHPNLAVSFNNLATLFQSRGEYAQAEPFYRDALAMYRKLYPPERFPQGHPDLARTLHNLGTLLWARGEYAQAEPFYRDALAMYQGLAEAYAALAAEAQALNYLASLPVTRDTFLSVTAEQSGASAADTYRLLWQGKAALLRVLEQRQRLLRAAKDAATRAQVEQLLDVRQQLARVLLAPAGDSGEQQRGRRLQELTERKEALETELARQLPELARQRADQRAAYTTLSEKLPPRAAFVDLLRYGRSAKDPKAKATPHYVAFVLRPGQSVRRVELGPAAPIEEALAAWRRDIGQGLPSVAAEQLRRLVWERLAEHLGADTTLVYLSPDGELSALPWAALPGSRPDRVLLEDHTLALVPHGPFLLEQLTSPVPARTAPGTLLALGGVRYDAAPDAVRQPTEASLVVRGADRGEHPGTWAELPGTARELDQLRALAQRLPQPPQLLERRGTAASTAQLLLDLPQARWAHLATHGFFAAPKSDVRQNLFNERDFQLGVGQERAGVGARNPLTQSGLVLAGANRQAPDATSDGGILTAEALAGLPLDKLDLAVLSACETGLGEAATGEGVFGLQRAFHLAGARNVVASLWRVDDEATAALMALFYHHLWEEKRPPREALRQAQLALYRHPQEVSQLAKARGADFDKTVKRVTQPAAEPMERPKGTAPVKYWAAFVLSGSGQ